jgi:hypothetical protein
MRRLFLGLIFLASCTSSTPEVAVNIEALKLHISAFEGISPERLATLDGDVAAALIAIADDPTARAFYKARAFQALSYYPEERVFRYLKKSLSRYETLGFTILPVAVESIANFGERYPEEVTEVLAPLVANGSLVVKEITVRALSVTPSIRAKNLLSEMALKENESAIQDALRAAGALR